MFQEPKKERVKGWAQKEKQKNKKKKKKKTENGIRWNSRAQGTHKNLYDPTDFLMNHGQTNISVKISAAVLFTQSEVKTSQNYIAS